MLASFLASLGRIRSPIPEPHVYRKLSHPELAMKIGPSSCMVPVQTRLRGGCDWPVVMAVFRCRDQPRLRTLVETSCVSNSRCRCRCKRLHGERTHPATKSKGEWAPAAVQPRCSVASHQRRAAGKQSSGVKPGRRVVGSPQCTYEVVGAPQVSSKFASGRQAGSKKAVATTCLSPEVTNSKDWHAYVVCWRGTV